MDELRTNGFLDRRFVDVPAGLDRALHPPRLPTRIGRFFRTLRLEWMGADRLIRWLHRHGLRWFFPPVSVWAGVVVALAGLVAFLVTVSNHRFTLSGGGLAYGFLLLLLLNVLLTMVHEIGHAVTLVHFGRRVKSAGVMIYFGSPAFFIESSDGLMLGRWQRIAQSFAGPWAELVLAGAVSMVIAAFPGWFLAPLLFKFAALNYLVITMNLIPLLELDVGAVLVPILAFFFIKDGKKLRDGFIHSVDRKYQFVVHQIMQDLHRLLSQYLRALVILSMGGIRVLFGISQPHRRALRGVAGGRCRSRWNSSRRWGRSSPW